MRFLLFPLLILFFIIPLYSQDYQEKVMALEYYMEAANEDWKMPGFSYAVVKDGDVLVSKGFGHTDLSQTRRVDEKTIFCIGSTTKAMTAALMAMLVDEGKVHWNDKVIKHLPGFSLYDPYVTRELRIRDLFTHNAGLGNADILWATMKMNTEEILDRMKLIRPSYSFRGGYTYQNLMYVVAGEVIREVSGMPWEGMLKQRIFEPLDMANSFPTRQSSSLYENRSRPHHFVEDRITTIEDFDDDMVAPAGSVWSCVDDMAKWTKFVLDSAKVEGNRLISAENYREWLKPQAMVSDRDFYFTQQITKPHWKTYALGWFQHDYQGRAVSFHTGSLPGTIAIMGLIPDESLGVYMLGNLDHAELRHALMYTVFDLFGSGDAERDWSTEILTIHQTNLANTKKRVNAIKSARRMDAPSLLKYDELAGKYVNYYLGKIGIKVEGENLKVTIGQSITDLSHWHDDVFRFKLYEWTNPTFITFKKGLTGEMALEAFGHSFTKEKDKE